MKYIPALLIIFFTTLYIGLNVFYFTNRTPISPDESQALLFSEEIAKNFTFSHRNILNSIFSEKIFAARQYVQVQENTFPSAFLGYIIILGLFRLINTDFIIIVGPLLAGLCLFYTYKITLHLSNNKTAIIALILMAVFPGFIYWTVSYFNNIAELAFTLGMLFYLFKSSKESSSTSFFVSLVYLSLAVWVRYTNLLLLPLVIVLFLILNKRFFNFKTITVSLLICVSILLPILIGNKIMFGSYLTLGQNSKDQLVYTAIDDGMPKEKLPFIPFRDFNILVNNSEKYLLMLFPVLIPLGILGILQLLKKKELNNEIYILIFLNIIWILYYMGGIFQGYFDDFAALNSSYVRYLLVVYMTLIIFSSYFITNSHKFYINLLLTMSLMLIFINSLFNSTKGIVALKDQRDSYSSWLSEYMVSTTPHSITFVKAADKVIYPSRDIALYQMLSEKYGNNEGIDRTLSLMSDAIHKGYKVYFIKEDTYNIGEKSQLYINKLSSHNLFVKDYNTKLSFYEIGAL